MQSIQLYRPSIPAYEPADEERVKHSRLRRRMLYGEWREDLIEYTKREVGTERYEAWGVVDLTGNPLRSISQAVAVLYDRPPIIQHDDARAAARMTMLLDEAGWAPLMARVQRDTIGLREMLIRVDVDDAVRVSLRPVWPDMVSAEPGPRASDLPGMLAETVQYKVGGVSLWCYDVWHDSGKHEVIAAQSAHGYALKQDVTALSGSGPMVLDASGAPVIPYALYHASRTGYLWDAHEGMEVVEGTLAIGSMWSMQRHVMRSASWPQRYAAGVQVAGMQEAPDGSGRAQITTDPATVLMLEMAGEDRQSPVIGQWQAGGDPKELAEAILMYEQRIEMAFGHVAAVSRKSGDPRSGYALAVSREEQRDAARRLEPQFRRGDLELLRIVAALVNARTPDDLLPETGWAISYQSLPPSQSEIDGILSRVEGGLMSRVDAYIELHPGMTPEQAARDLAAMAAESTPTAPAPPALLPEEPEGEAQ